MTASVPCTDKEQLPDTKSDRHCEVCSMFVTLDIASVTDSLRSARAPGRVNPAEEPYTKGFSDTETDR